MWTWVAVGWLACLQAGSVRVDDSPGRLHLVRESQTFLAGEIDGAGPSARFRDPAGLALDAAGNLLVADRGNHRIRSISPAGVVSTLAGSGANYLPKDGRGVLSHIPGPSRILSQTEGGCLFADEGGLRRLHPDLRVETLFTWDSSPRYECMAISGAGEAYFVRGGGWQKSAIYRQQRGSPLELLAGDPDKPGEEDGPARSARFASIEFMALSPDGTLWVLDSLRTGTGSGYRIRVLSKDGMVRTHRTVKHGEALAFDCVDGLEPVLWSRAGAQALIRTVQGQDARIELHPAKGSAPWPEARAIRTLLPHKSGGAFAVFGQAVLRIDGDGACALLAGGMGSGSAPLPADGPIQPFDALAWDPSGHPVSAIEGTLQLKGLPLKVSQRKPKTPLGDPSGAWFDEQGRTWNLEQGGWRHRLVLRSADGTVRTELPVTLPPEHRDASDAAALVRDGQGTFYAALVVPEARTRLLRIAPDGKATPLGDTAFDARVKRVVSLRLDGLGNLWMADFGDHMIKRLPLATGALEVMAGQPGLSGLVDGARGSSRLDGPTSLAAGSGGAWFIGDGGNQALRRLDPDGTLHTVDVFDGATGIPLTFSQPLDMGFRGPELFVIRGIEVWSGLVTKPGFVVHERRRFGQGSSSFQVTKRVLGFTSGGEVCGFVGDPSGWTVPFRLASTGSMLPSDPGWRSCTSLLSLGDGRVLLADPAAHVIRQLGRDGAKIFAGQEGIAGSSDGPLDRAVLDAPALLALDRFGAVLVSERGTGRIRRIHQGTIQTLWQVSGNAGLAVTADGIIHALDKDSNPFTPLRLNRFDGKARVDVPLPKQLFENLEASWGRWNLDGKGRGYSLAGGTLRIQDIRSGAIVSRRISGLPDLADPEFGWTVDGAGNLYVCDADGHRFLRAGPDGRAKVFAGSGRPGHGDGKGRAAQFRSPGDVAWDPRGFLLVADTGNHCLRRIDPDGRVTTVAGRPGSPGVEDGLARQSRFWFPVALAWERDGSLVVFENRLEGPRRLSSEGTVSTLDRPLPRGMGILGPSFDGWRGVAGGVRGGVVGGVVGGAGRGSVLLRLPFSESPRFRREADSVDLKSPSRQEAHLAVDSRGNRFIAWKASLIRLAPDGAVTWIARSDGFPSPRLDRVPAVLPSITAISVAPDDTLWISAGDGVLRWRDREGATVPSGSMGPGK